MRRVPHYHLARLIRFFVPFAVVLRCPCVAIRVCRFEVGTEIVDLELRLVLRQRDLASEYLVVLYRRVDRVVELLSKYRLRLYFFDYLGDFLLRRHLLALYPLHIVLVDVRLLVKLGAWWRSILVTLAMPVRSFAQLGLLRSEVLVHLGYLLPVLSVVVRVALHYLHHVAHLPRLLAAL